MRGSGDHAGAGHLLQRQVLSGPDRSKVKGAVVFPCVADYPKTRWSSLPLCTCEKPFPSTPATSSKWNSSDPSNCLTAVNRSYYGPSQKDRSLMTRKMLLLWIPLLCVLITPCSSPAQKKKNFEAWLADFKSEAAAKASLRLRSSQLCPKSSTFPRSSSSRRTSRNSSSLWKNT